MYRRMDKVSGTVKSKLENDPKTARLNKQQVKLDNFQIAASNNVLLSKIAGMLSKLGGSMDSPVSKKHKSHRHHRH